MGGINLHPSLLPLHRGPVPTIHALAEDSPRFGVTVHRLAARIDAGAILAQRAVALPAGVTASAAARALHRAGVPLLEEALAALAAGTATERCPEPLPYCPFPHPRCCATWRDGADAWWIAPTCARRCGARQATGDGALRSPPSDG